MRHGPWLAAIWIMGFAVKAVAADLATPAAEATPVVTAEHASPRATLTTFLEAFYEDPADLDRAAGCLDLGELPSEIRGIKGRELRFAFGFCFVSFGFVSVPGFRKLGSWNFLSS